MPAHTKMLRTLGLEPKDNLLAANLVAGADMATFEQLSVIAHRMPRDEFFELIRLFDGFHLYGPDIYKLLAMNRERAIRELRDSIFGGFIACSHCGIYMDPASVLEIIRRTDESLAELVRKFPAGACPKARVLYDNV
jgi:hypothetical protein